MSTVIIEIPEAFARSFGATDEEVARNAKIELAIEMYRQGRWSTGRAGEFAGMNRWAFMEVLKTRNVEMPYTKEMIEEDLAHARRSF
jgi:predicted HTH domain antitoxin